MIITNLDITGQRQILFPSKTNTYSENISISNIGTEIYPSKENKLFYQKSLCTPFYGAKSLTLSV